MGQLLALFFSISYGLSNVFTSKAMEHGEFDRFTGLYITVLINTIINALVIIVYLSFVNSIEINLKGIMFFGIAGLLNSFLARGVFLLPFHILGYQGQVHLK
ncbi:MAG TPA: hypothetical protein PK985_03790 [Bacillota bacterium]|nr:hypothetical protein [Bacillota bacterium]